MDEKNLKRIKQQIVNDCAAEVRAVLLKHGCRMVPHTVIVDGKVDQRIVIKLIDKEKQEKE